MNHGNKCHVCEREDVRLYRIGGAFARPEQTVLLKIEQAMVQNLAVINR